MTDRRSQLNVPHTLTTDEAECLLEYLPGCQTLDELGAIIDSLSCDSINRYLAANPPRDFTIVTLGAKELEARLGIS